MIEKTTTNLVTVDQARTMFCPFAMREDQWERCVNEACMAWREVRVTVDAAGEPWTGQGEKWTELRGYCGLAGEAK